VPVSPARHLPLAELEILIVDDEPDARYLLNFLLEQYGATVRTAESAQMALQALEAFQPDLLVSDLGMPEMDGYALIRQIRSQGRSFSAIALTAYAREEDRNAALDAGFQAHVTKPIEPAELVKTIATLAGRSM
jgi:CheY-like chemotaxis protein